MQRRFFARIAAATGSLLVAAGLMLVPSSAAAMSNNVATNGGFESGDLRGWSCTSGGSVATAPAHSGTYALAATPHGSDSAKCTQTVSVQPNSAYTLSAFVRGSYVYLGAVGTGTGQARTWTPSASSWTQLATSFTTGPSTTSVTIYLHGWYGQPTYHADDVTVSGPGGDGGEDGGDGEQQDPPQPPDPGPGGELPEHTLTGYWHNFLNGSTALEISDVPSSYDVIAVAFGVGGDQPGEVTFDLDNDLQAALGGYSKAEFISDIQAKHVAGKKVILSVGGARARIDLGGPQGATNFAYSVYELMQEYGFDGVDIDLEGRFDPSLLASALHQLANLAGEDLILTMAPQTYYVQPGMSYLQLIKQTANIITTVHTQYYNSGSMVGCDGSIVAQGDVDFMTAQACILLRKTLDPDQVAFGLPATPRAAGSGYVDPSLIKNALDCMAYGTSCGDFQPRRTYPQIRGAMTWSINWDAANGYAFADSIAPYLDTLP